MIRTALIALTALAHTRTAGHKKKKKTLISLNINYRTEMKLVLIIMN